MYAKINLLKCKLNLDIISFLLLNYVSIRILEILVGYNFHICNELKFLIVIYRIVVNTVANHKKSYIYNCIQNFQIYFSIIFLYEVSNETFFCRVQILATNKNVDIFLSFYSIKYLGMKQRSDMATTVKFRFSSKFFFF